MDEELHASEIFSSSSGCSFTMNKAKKKKVVCILNSMHKNVNIKQFHKKKLLRDDTVLQQAPGEHGCAKPGDSLPFHQEFHYAMASGCVL